MPHDRQARAIHPPTILTDTELTAAIARLAASERNATTELVEHLAEFDARKLHLAAGFPSLFAYCCERLHLSEHQTYNRIEAARALRRFPLLLEELASGRLNLTTVRLLAPHLTEANHGDLVGAACHLKKAEVEKLIAERFPRPDVVARIRKVPEPQRAAPQIEAAEPCPAVRPPPGECRKRPAEVRPLSPLRYEIRFTATEDTREKLRRAQDQLRHAIPSGDVALIFDRALTLLLADIARKQAAEVRVPASTPRPVGPGSRHIPAQVRRSVWARDGGRCGFVSAGGRRCAAVSFLEFHHLRPYAVGGEATADNIALRCRTHNGYEADLFYGPLRREAPADVGTLHS